MATIPERVWVKSIDGIDVDEEIEYVRKDLVDDLKAELAACQQQRDELLEALEFYADERNHEGDVDPDYQWTGQPKYYPSEVSADEGAIARAAIRKARSE
ncbi:MAG: hypothetical protein ACXACY_31235 [Candidatus Hodarchaeales archaeon]|jgi:hypothetical protein